MTRGHTHTLCVGVVQTTLFESFCRHKEKAHSIEWVRLVETIRLELMTSTMST